MGRRQINSKSNKIDCWKKENSNFGLMPKSISLMSEKPMLIGEANKDNWCDKNYIWMYDQNSMLTKLSWYTVYKQHVQLYTKWSYVLKDVTIQSSCCHGEVTTSLRPQGTFYPESFSGMRICSERLPFHLVTTRQYANDMSKQLLVWKTCTWDAASW